MFMGDFLGCLWETSLDVCGFLDPSFYYLLLTRAGIELRKKVGEHKCSMWSLAQPREN
jgi:hypothetical protein